MAFTIPTFNLTCDVYRWVVAPGPLTVIALSPDCNLQFARKSNVAIQGLAFVEPDVTCPMFLLLPVGTDVRPCVCYGITDRADLIEVPSGSGRIYIVLNVDDVGKGFSNEYRVATILPTAAYGNWPTPIP